MMKQLNPIVAILLVLTGLIPINAQNWHLVNSENGEKLNTSLIDSITHEESAGVYLHKLWRDGTVISENAVTTEMKFKIQEEPTVYYELNYEDDGIDAVITDSGLFALLTQVPDRDEYILVDGIIDEQATKEYLLIDENGFLKAISLDNGEIIHIFYTPQSLLLISNNGTTINEIPYSILSDGDTITPLADPAGTRATYTRSRIFRALKLRNSIKNWFKQPVKKASQELLRHISEGVGNRYGGLASDLIDLAFDWNDIISWLEMLDRLEEISYFGNTKITASNAVKVKVCTFRLPCKVENLSFNYDFVKVLGAYETLSSYRYFLTMDTRLDRFLADEYHSEEKEIYGDGIEEFEFTFQELEESYTYEPHLKLDLEVNVSVDKDTYEQLAQLCPNAPGWTPESYTLRRSCTIYGNQNSLFTGSVNSSVIDVQNIKNRSADIICDFSDVPAGAECNVNLTIDGSDISFVFKATSDNNNQKVCADNLIPNTSYTAYTSISYKDRHYPGSNTIDFRTTGPTGTVKEIGMITDHTAVVTCLFSNLELNSECGIYVRNEDGATLSFPASATDGEQYIQVSGLEPGTIYRCWVFINTPTSSFEDENYMEFTTLPSDISGTWNCRQENWNNITHQTSFETYSITLNPDGSVACSKYPDIVSGSWSYSIDGKLTIAIMDMATQSFNSGFNWTFTADDPKNPTSFTGYCNGWNYNNVIGYVQGDGHACELSR